MLTEQQFAALRSELGSTRVAKAMALAGVAQVTLAKALRLTQPYVSDVARGRYRTTTVENGWKFSAYFGCRIEDLFPSPRRPSDCSRTDPRGAAPRVVGNSENNAVRTLANRPRR